MPVRANIGSGSFQIRPNIIRDDEDPYERALKAAKLENLRNEGRFQERSLRLQELGLEDTRANHEALRAYQEAGLLESIRTNKARELHEGEVFGETKRFNQAREQHDVNMLGETSRANWAREAEQNRSALASDITQQRGQNLQLDATKEQQRAELLKTLLTQMYASGDQTKPELTERKVAEVMKAFGYPQFGTGLGMGGSEVVAPGVVATPAPGVAVAPTDAKSAEAVSLVTGGAAPTQTQWTTERPQYNFTPEPKKDPWTKRSPYAIEPGTFTVTSPPTPADAKKAEAVGLVTGQPLVTPTPGAAPVVQAPAGAGLVTPPLSAPLTSPYPTAAMNMAQGRVPVSGLIEAPAGQGGQFDLDPEFIEANRAIAAQEARYAGDLAKRERAAAEQLRKDQRQRALYERRVQGGLLPNPRTTISGPRF